MKTIKNLEELGNICNSDYSIYGAGYVSGLCMRYFNLIGKKPQCIYVSSPYGNPVEISNITVRCISDVTDIETVGKTLVICVSEAKQIGLLDSLKDTNFKEIFTISDDVVNELKAKLVNKFELIEEKVQKMEDERKRQYINLLKFVKKPCLEYMIVNIVDHCNLRCKGCDHFACIAEERIYKRDDIKKDVERMSEIFDGDYIMKIAVMGGEPLLHPELKEILSDVRESFPHAVIRLTTNGLLLLQQDESFWRICRENRITIVNTKYPINLDFEGMKLKASEEGVEFKFFEDTGETVFKTSFKKMINLDGDSNPTEQFANCHIANYGNILLDGKFYGCPFSIQSYRIFNKKFNQNLRMTEKDYIDIYKAKSKEEFLEFAARPKFYCRYCLGKSPTFPWARSKQQMDEWI